MSRTYGEPVDVWVRDGKPARFAWRGKLYTVTVVLDHWVISREWWKQQNPDLGTPAEREFWRVDASPGADTHTGTYELRHDLATGHWMLARAWDLTSWPGRAASSICTSRRPTRCGMGSRPRPTWSPGPPGSA